MKMTRELRELLKSIACGVWFRPNKARKVLVGPYRGLRFKMSSQLRERMGVYYREYEPDVAAYLRRWVAPGAVVLDVGAHIGIHAMYMAQLMKNRGQVYAFEAWPDNFHQLQENISLNRSHAVKPVHLAVTAGSSTVSFTQGRTSGMHHVSEPGESTSFVVEGIDLDSFCESNGVAPSLLLVDVEGNELDVLEGARATLGRYRPKLILEHHGQGDKIEAALREIPYSNIQVIDRHVFAWD
jgi:FkbM family methyltransferase